MNSRKVFLKWCATVTVWLTICIAGVMTECWADDDSGVVGVFDMIKNTAVKIVTGSLAVIMAIWSVIQIWYGATNSRPDKVVGGIIGLIIAGSIGIILAAFGK